MVGRAACDGACTVLMLPIQPWSDPAAARSACSSAIFSATAALFGKQGDDDGALINISWSIPSSCTHDLSYVESCQSFPLTTENLSLDDETGIFCSDIFRVWLGFSSVGWDVV